MQSRTILTPLQWEIPGNISIGCFVQIEYMITVVVNNILLRCIDKTGRTADSLINKVYFNGEPVRVLDSIPLSELHVLTSQVIRSFGCIGSGVEDIEVVIRDGLDKILYWTEANNILYIRAGLLGNNVYVTLTRLS